jgi:hypothetical protein
MATFTYKTNQVSLIIQGVNKHNVWYIFKVKGVSCGLYKNGVCVPQEAAQRKHLLQLICGNKFRRALWRHVAAVENTYASNRRQAFERVMRKLICSLIEEEIWWSSIKLEDYIK